MGATGADIIGCGEKRASTEKKLNEKIKEATERTTARKMKTEKRETDRRFISNGQMNQER